MLEGLVLSSGHLLVGRLTSSLRLQLPCRHGDGCESAITNKNNPAAHVCTTCRWDSVPTRFPSSRARHSRDASRGTDAGCPSKGRCGPIELPTPGPKGKLSVRLNGTNPLRTREALRVDVSCYSNELLLSPQEPPMCPEASPPTRPSFLASASVEGGYRRSSGMSIRKSLASYFSCNAATLRLRRGGLRFVLTRLKHVANGRH